MGGGGERPCLYASARAHCLCRQGQIREGPPSFLVFRAISFLPAYCHLSRSLVPIPARSLVLILARTLVLVPALSLVLIPVRTLVLIPHIPSCPFPRVLSCPFPRVLSCSFPRVPSCSFPRVPSCSFPRVHSCPCRLNFTKGLHNDKRRRVRGSLFFNETFAPNPQKTWLNDDPAALLLADSAKVVILHEGMGGGLDEVKCAIFPICEGANSFVAAMPCCLPTVRRRELCGHLVACQRRKGVSCATSLLPVNGATV